VQRWSSFAKLSEKLNYVAVRNFWQQQGFRPHPSIWAFQTKHLLALEISDGNKISSFEKFGTWTPFLHQQALSNQLLCFLRSPMKYGKFQKFADLASKFLGAISPNSDCHANISLGDRLWNSIYLMETLHWIGCVPFAIWSKKV